MQNSNTTTYVKKLVKIVYEKEKQIQNMKKILKERNRGEDRQNFDAEIPQDIKRQVEKTTTRMKQLNMHVLAMEQKMLTVEEQLGSQIEKNSLLTQENKALEMKYQDTKKVVNEQFESLQEFQQMVNSISIKKEQFQREIMEANRVDTEQVQGMKEEEERLKLQVIKLQTALSQIKLELRSKSTQLKSKSESLEDKNKQISLLTQQLIFKEKTIEKLNQEIEELNQSYTSFENDVSLMKLEVETLQDSLNVKQSHFSMLNETLKDYQEFAFQISQYIESAYMKHCCQGKLRSSKKLIRQVDNCKTRFEAAFCKINQIQHWMDVTADKLDKIIAQNQLPDDTLEDLSIIAHSFEEKLDLCDLTERIEKEKIEMDENEQILLDKLQKQMQKSDLRDRSKLVELDQVQQVLKVTKDINRELLSELNTKDFIISECRKMYTSMAGNKNSPDIRNLKTLLNMKQ